MENLKGRIERDFPDFSRYCRGRSPGIFKSQFGSRQVGKVFREGEFLLFVLQIIRDIVRGETGI